LHRRQFRIIIAEVALVEQAALSDEFTRQHAMARRIQLLLEHAWAVADLRLLFGTQTACVAVEPFLDIGVMRLDVAIQRIRDLPHFFLT